MTGPLTGSFRYTRSEGAFLLGGLSPYEVLVPQVREIWVAADGSGRLRTEYGDPIFFGDKDRQAWGAQKSKRVDDMLYGPGQLSFTDISTLPRDPTELLRSIRAARDPSDVGAGSEAWEALIAARSYLWETVPPKDLSLAAMEMLQSLNDITEARGRDPAGRDSVAFAVENKQFRNTIWLDPKTGALLGEQQDLLVVLPTVDAAPPVTIKRATYSASKMVSSTDSR